MLQKFECAVILRYIDPIDRQEFDDLDNENSIGGIKTLWGQVRDKVDSMRATYTGAQQTSISANKRSSVKIKKQIRELKSDKWIEDNQDIAWKIKETSKAVDEDITRDLIENYEMRKQEEKYKEWSSNNKDKSNRVDQIFNAYGSKPDYNLFRTRLIEKGVLSINSTLTWRKKIWKYFEKCCKTNNGSKNN